MRQPSSSTWILASALVCALAGLLLKATEPAPMSLPTPRVASRPSPRHATRVALVAAATHARRRGEPSAAPVPSTYASLDDAAVETVVARDDGWFPAAPPRPGVARARVVPAAVAPAPIVDSTVSVAPRPKRPGVRRPLRGKRDRLARLASAAGESRLGSPPPLEPVPTRTLPVPPTPGPSALPTTPAPTTAATDPPPPPPVAFDSGTAAQFPTAGQVSIPIPAPDPQEGGSVSLVVQSGWERGNQDGATLVQLGDGLRVEKTVDVLRLETADGGPDIGVPIGEWNPGEWHHVAATWKGNDVALYVDGELVGRHTGDVPIQLPPETNLLVGSDDADHQPVARGMIGHVAVRRGALGDDQVLRDYHDTLGADDGRGRAGGPDAHGDPGVGFGDRGLLASGSDPGRGHDPRRGFAH